MPDPREAVYDVLLAKKRRAEEATRLQEQRTAFYRNQAEAWAAYEEENERANAATRSPRGVKGSRPALVILDEINQLENSGPPEA